MFTIPLVSRILSMIPEVSKRCVGKSALTADSRTQISTSYSSTFENGAVVRFDRHYRVIPSLLASRLLGGALRCSLTLAMVKE
jgi:hypothetical protein